jgi:hypothetical protein
MNIAVIDTETNWYDKVMSIGIVISDENYNTLESLYYDLTPESNVGGMFSSVLYMRNQKPTATTNRRNATTEITEKFKAYDVQDIFAYNARFDYSHLPELQNYVWHDIIKIAAYRQYNPALPKNLVFCNSGRLKSGYGVEPIYQYLSKNPAYREVHNALCDAVDELQIMQMLGYSPDAYVPL